MLMEMMGLHLPGAAFVHPGTPLRDALTAAAAKRAPWIDPRNRATRTRRSAHVVDEKSVVNAIVGLLATGGSTNHTLHWWPWPRRRASRSLEDFDDLSRSPRCWRASIRTASADVNQFHAAGGMAFVTRELLGAWPGPRGRPDRRGRGLRRYTRSRIWTTASWSGATARGVAQPRHPAPRRRPVRARGRHAPADRHLGRGVIKTSAVKPENRIIEAPAAGVRRPGRLLAAFKPGELNRDFIAVVRFQGPRPTACRNCTR
jgi:phosphogluconate dehydratase